MALQYIDSLASSNDYEIHVSYFAGNVTMGRQLAQLKHATALHYHPGNIVSGAFQGIRTLVSPRNIQAVYRAITTIKPDIVVVLQGNIEACTLAMVAAKLANIPLLSYIPLAHSMKVFGARFWYLRDQLHKMYYRLPDHFIAISQDQKRKITAHGVSPERISVVHNFIPDVLRLPIEKREARHRFGISTEKFLVGLIGRVDFKQKRQDFLLRAIAENQTRLGEFHFAVIGCGPDELRLKELVEEYALGESVSIFPWSNDTSVVYSALDALVLPSAFEGVPLVMLEAIQYGLPVIASNVDGMSEFLPNEWLFEPDSINTMVTALLSLKSAGTKVLLDRLRSSFATDFDQVKSATDFARVIDSYIASGKRIATRR